MPVTSTPGLRRFKPRWGDVVLAGFLWFLSMAGLGDSSLTGRGGFLLPFLWSLGYTLPLVWRRTFPVVATLALLPAHLLQVALNDVPIPGNVVVPVMIYAVARYGEQTWAKRCLWLAVAGSLLAGLDWGWNVSWGSNALLDNTVRVLGNAIACLAVVLACWFAGQWARQRDLTTQSWKERAEALERERAQGRALVAQEERNRLAREMHDIVAHSLSVIVVQSDGAGYLASHSELGDPEARLAQVTKAIETIGQTARTALGETRRLVGVLRQEDEEMELAPSATIDQIGELVEQLRAAGIPATFRVLGDEGSHGPFSEGAQMAVYRVVQESLTNVMKHAGAGATVDVTLTHGRDGLSVRVADTGSGPTGTDGLGHGLVGMRERMAAWGGQLNAGPRRGGGFEVFATLPAQPGPPPASATAPAPPPVGPVTAGPAPTTQTRPGPGPTGAMAPGPTPTTQQGPAPAPASITRPASHPPERTLP
ncbi:MULTISPECIES: sensor histidine kinase [unclassified Luteococcus]|uniref:sensor histidine kinase n=1 Tax=unclassified Luteococcus TaxID=2639923 RepID=UPI00313B607A